MKKKIIIPIVICFLVFISLSAYGVLVGHPASQIFEDTFIGNFIFDGNVNVTGNIVANEPVDNSHVATKSYVDANGGSSSVSLNTLEYLGITSTSYNGNLGGLKGAADKCSTEFGAGARMLETKDILTLTNKPTVNGWYHCSDEHMTQLGVYNSPLYYCMGVRGGGNKRDSINCQEWKQNSGSIYGGISPSNIGSQSNCGGSYKIHCVRDNIESYFENGGDNYYCKRKGLTNGGYWTESDLNEAQRCATSPNAFCDADGNCAEDKVYVMYVTESGSSGNLGGRAGADAFCNSQMPSSLNCSDVRAFLSIDSDDEIRDFPATFSNFDTSAPIYWVSSSNIRNRMANDWSDLLDGSILITQIEGTGSSNSVWTFSYSDGSLQPNNCNGGTSSSSIYSGNYASSGYTNTYWISHSTVACDNTAYRIRCLCEPN